MRGVTELGHYERGEDAQNDNDDEDFDQCEGPACARHRAPLLPYSASNISRGRVEAVKIRLAVAGHVSLAGLFPVDVILPHLDAFAARRQAEISISATGG